MVGVAKDKIMNLFKTNTTKDYSVSTMCMEGKNNKKKIK